MTHGPEAALVLAGALALDVFVGEPPRALHPVVWMGRLQRALRKRAPLQPAAQLAYGAVMALVGPLVFAGGAWLILRALRGTPLYDALRLLVAVYLLKSAFAVRALAAAAAGVARALSTRDLAAAREALRSLVSRDTRLLDEPRLAAAAIESVAENASDSLVAPLFFYALLGVPGALAYRAANTLDALIGYHGETEWLGKPAARLDDLLNYVPARLTAALLVIASAIWRASPIGGLRIWLRDARVTESPNAGRPMAAMAGALGVELEKVGSYRLGAGQSPPTRHDIDRAVAIMTTACLLAALLAAMISWWRA